jgi:hypothetical protein
MMAALIFLTIGVGLGLCFTVPVLIPATLVVIAITIIRGHLHAHAVSGFLFAAFCAAALLQIGFFLGSILRPQLPLRRNNDAPEDVNNNSTFDCTNLLSSSLID